MFERDIFVLSAKGFSLLLLLFLAAQFCDGQEKPKQTTPEVLTLEINEPVEREIAAKEIHNYQFTLAENQFASVIVEQRGIDVAARVLRSSEKKPFIQRDSVLTAEGQEKLDFTATTAGIYVLQIEGKTMLAAKGNYLVRLAEIRPATEREKRLEQARTIHNDGIRLWNEGKFVEGLSVAERAVEIREKESGADDIDVAASLASLALIVNDLGDYERAISLYERALKIRQKAFGENHQDVARIYHNLALVYVNLDVHEEAVRLWTKAAEIREKVLGPDNLELASTLNNLGSEYKVLGDYEKAESFARRGLEIKERAAVPIYSSIAASQNTLAGIYAAKGDKNKALEIYKQALVNREKELDPEHPNVASALFSTASIYSEMSEFALAEADFSRALKIMRKAYGQDHQLIAAVLGSLAILYYRQGDDAKAEPLFLQTVAMMEKTVGKEHSNYAAAIVNLAEFYTNKGDYQKAEPLYQQAISINEKLFGAQHHSLILYLTDLARNYEAQGKVDLAFVNLKRAHEISERHSQIVLFAQSEKQKLSYIDSLNAETNIFISAQQQFAPDNPVALELALTTILERKGLISDSVALGFAALQSRFNAGDRKILAELAQVNSILAQKSLNESPKAKPEEYQKQIAELENRKETLEIEISRRSSEFRSRTQTATISAVRDAIPENAALIEFSVYRPFDPKKKLSEAFGEPRYVAYIVRKKGAIISKDLGLARTIDESIEPFRQALRDPKRSDVQNIARVVDEKIMQPVRAILGDAKQLLISPDGALNLIPFEALVDEQNRYLIENYSFTYLASGRDLLRMQTARASKSKSLLIANPQFGESISEQTIASNQTKPKSRAKRRSVTATRNMTDTYFAPISGTLQEARSIQTLFPDAQFLTGTRATETALKQANAPEILHIATHGFFLEDANSISIDDKDKSLTARDAKTTLESDNPLLRSGLAFAGANRRDAKNGDDGILTALEASGLNLWGTKLVVLSACDTGLGEVKNGEGVYGLRRSFVLAGAESLVMSLWSVSDYVTRETMIDYYKNLKNGMGRGESLRQVKLEMLKKKGRAHPFYWAAFIQSGEWANLDGKR